MSDERDWKAVWAATERVVAGGHPRSASGGEDADTYGRGPAPERLEARVAALLAKEAAVWMPSGTMAQQIALRIHADRRKTRTVAFHPHCHLDVHEERGYEHLHGLRAKLLGGRNRLVEPADLDGVHEPLAAVLLELPQRDLGGRLPAWDELVTLCHKAREHGAAVHLDGARLWQCGPLSPPSTASTRSCRGCPRTSRTRGSSRRRSVISTTWPSYPILPTSRCSTCTSGGHSRG